MRFALGSLQLGFSLSVLLAGALAAWPMAARAADGDKPTYDLGLYVWGAMIAGEVDTPKVDSTMRMSFSDVWDNLNVAVMARGRANFGKASLVMDLEYFDLESDKEQHTIRLGPEGNIEIPADVKVEFLQWLFELNAGYQIFDVKGPFSAGPGDERGTTGELYAGGRYYAMQPEIRLDLGASGRDIGEWHSWVDAVVGARLGIDLSKTVVLGIQGDVGGFNIGNSDKFAWSQITSLTWQYSDAMSLSLGYKFLDIKREPSSDQTLKLQLRGPFIATFFRF